MKNRPEDIYKNEQMPRFARRSFARKEAHHLRTTAPGVQEEQAEGTPALFTRPPPPQDEGPARMPAYGGRMERKRKRHRPGQAHPRLIGLGIAGLLLIVLAYGGLLAFFKSSQKKSDHPLLKSTVTPETAAGGASSASATPDPIVPDAVPSSAAEMDQLIKSIKETTAFLHNLQKPPLSKLSNSEQAAACESRLLASPTQVELLLETARKQGLAGNHARAAELYEKVLASTPGNREARLLLAQTHLKSKNYDAAVSAAKWILAEESFSLDAQQILASVFMTRKQTALAIPHLRALVEGDTVNTVPRNNLAVAYTQIGEYDKAIKMFRGVLEQDENNPVTYNNLAICYAQKGDLVESTATLRQAARRFGAAFVSSWIKGQEFDTVRNSAPFQTLLTGLETGRVEGGSSGGVILDTPLNSPDPKAKPTDTLPVPASPAGSQGS
jgi:Flp pilus assembly protein TadD